MPERAQPKTIAQVIVSVLSDGQMIIQPIQLDASGCLHLLSKAAKAAADQPLTIIPHTGIVEAPAAALHMLGQPKRGEG